MIKSKLVWGLFIFSGISTFIYSVLMVAGVFTDPTNALSYFFLAMPFMALGAHVLSYFGYKNALLFLLLSSTAGWLFETLGLKFGVFFGGTYVYNIPMPNLGLVPLPVIFYWPVFIYTAYCITDLFLKKHSVLLLILSDALLVTAIDLYMDPIQVALNHWSWPNGGLYFNIPTGNFVGWFVVSVTVTGIFRTYNYFSSRKTSTRSSNTNSTTNTELYIPLLGYLLMMLVFTMMALKQELYTLLPFGVFFMSAPLLMLFSIKSIDLRFNSKKL